MTKKPSKKPSKSAKKVQAALQDYQLDCDVVELPSSTRTAVDAANAVGCSVGQIVKSLIFMATESKQAVLVLASGPNRVDVDKIAALLGEAIGKADAAFVREQTGFAIGGVPPLGHKEKSITYIDEDLYQYQTIWAAAGTPNAVFKLTPEQLQQVSSGEIVKIKV